jgi:hypothetical protein
VQKEQPGTCSRPVLNLSRAAREPVLYIPDDTTFDTGYAPWDNRWGEVVERVQT